MAPIKCNRIMGQLIRLRRAVTMSARGRKCYITPAFSGIPNIGGQNVKWLPQPCLLGGPKEGGNAVSPLHYRGSPTPSAGSKI